MESGGDLDSEASLERAGGEDSRAVGGFGSGASRVGTLSDICLLTAAGAAGWMGVGELEHSATTSTSTLPRMDINNNLKKKVVDCFSIPCIY